MDQGRRSALILLAVVGCRDEPKQPPPPPPPIVADAAIAWDDDFAKRLMYARADVSQAYLAMKELRRSQVEGDLAFPEGTLPALDFTREGNAIITSDQWRARDVMPDNPRARIVHLADDPYRLAINADSMLSSDEDKAKYRAPRYRATIEQLLRARYVVFVVGTDRPATGFVHIDTPATFEGVALLYELASTKLLAGFRLRVASGVGMKLDDKLPLFRRVDPATLDLEQRMRDALWAALRTRSPSVKAPTLAYSQIDDA